MIVIHDRDGHEVPLADLAETFGVSYDTAYARYRRHGDNYARIVQEPGASAPYRATTFTDLTAEEHRQMYKRWSSMIRRCYDPRSSGYHNYGGRGIKVCDEWCGGVLGFKTYYMYVGRPPFPGAELDRIDNDGNYEPGNVRWVSHTKNGNNRRTNTYCWIDTDGGRKKMTLAEAARYSGISPSCLKTRYARGDRGNDLIRPVERAVRKAPRMRGRDPRVEEIASRYGEDYRSVYQAFARLNYDYDRLIEREESRRGKLRQTPADSQEVE